MLKGEALDEFMDRFWDFGDNTSVRYGRDGTGSFQNLKEEEYEEYRFKEDGLIIEPVHKGKVDKRTWIALAIMLVTVPVML